MERPPAGSRIVLDILRRAAAGDKLQESDEELANTVHVYADLLWITRFHKDVLQRFQLRRMLMRIDGFQKRWPKAAIEISKEVGWPDQEEP